MRIEDRDKAAKLARAIATEIPVAHGDEVARLAPDAAPAAAAPSASGAPARLGPLSYREVKREYDQTNKRLESAEQLRDLPAMNDLAHRLEVLLPDYFEVKRYHDGRRSTIWALSFTLLGVILTPLAIFWVMQGRLLAIPLFFPAVPGLGLGGRPGGGPHLPEAARGPRHLPGVRRPAGSPEPVPRPGAGGVGLRPPGPGSAQAWSPDGAKRVVAYCPLRRARLKACTASTMALA